MSRPAVRRAAFVASLLIALGACGTAPDPAPDSGAEQKQTTCERAADHDPAEVVCTAHVDPVCATVETGIVCVTTPCPYTRESTYANACEACRDPKVRGYVSGGCAGGWPR